MSDDLRAPVGRPMNDEGEVTRRDAEEIEDEDVEEIDEQISDDPVVEENETSYDPATQAPKEAQW